MRWRLAIAAVAVLLCAGCLGSLSHDQLTEDVALAAADKLQLPVRENHTYWLLRGVDGWRSSHEVKFGGNPSDSAVAAVRVVRFDSADAARNGYARLTPEYLQASLRDSIVGIPTAFDYPGRIPGDNTATYLYLVRMPPDTPPNVIIRGQFTVIRAGAMVLLVESIGVTPDRLVPALTALVRAAENQ
jgi:hypothetical protein